MNENNIQQSFQQQEEFDIKDLFRMFKTCKEVFLINYRKEPLFKTMLVWQRNESLQWYSLAEIERHLINWILKSTTSTIN